jgi:mercuric ion binding protein
LLISLPVGVFAATAQTAVLDIQNMTCPLCSITVHEVLEEISGVFEAKMDFDHKTASLTYEGEKATATALVKATTDAGLPSTVHSGATKAVTPPVILDSMLTCPGCGHTTLEEMPTNSCQFFHQCARCHMLIRPVSGDCCVFCSYGSVKCPPVQLLVGC